MDGVLQSAPAVTAGPPLVFTGVTVPAGGSAVLIYEAAVTDWAPLGTGAAITNTAVITGQNTDLTVSATVPAAAAPQLGITKTVSPADVAPGGSLTYTFTLNNTGTQADAAQEIVVSDVFDPVLSDLAVTLNGAPLSAAADYTYDEATGAFATVPGAVTVPAAAYAQQSDGSWAVTPGAAVLCVSGTV